MVRVFIIFFLFGSLISSNQSLAQCPEGSIGVSGAGCGCLAGCNLTSFGGPNCGAAGTAGNCTAGYVAMQVDIVVPDGCTFTVTATMMPRTGCSASGADGSCSTCDALKVDIPGGPKPMQFGGSNATLTDSYTLAGPATIRVSGSANRADEIITYSTTFSGAFCDACGSILPIELVSFSAEQEGKTIGLSWSTASEKNNAYFIVERSIDGIQFERIAMVNGGGNSSSQLNYKVYDSSPPFAEVIYYRLLQLDFDGNETTFDHTSIKFEYDLIHFSDGILSFNHPANVEQLNWTAEIYDSHGRFVERILLSQAFEQIAWNRPGVWIARFPELNYTERFSSF